MARKGPRLILVALAIAGAAILFSHVACTVFENLTPEQTFLDSIDDAAKLCGAMFRCRDEHLAGAHVVECHRGLVFNCASSLFPSTCPFTVECRQIEPFARCSSIGCKGEPAKCESGVASACDENLIVTTVCANDGLVCNTANPACHADSKCAPELSEQAFCSVDKGSVQVCDGANLSTFDCSE